MFHIPPLVWAKIMSYTDTASCDDANALGRVCRDTRDAQRDPIVMSMYLARKVGVYKALSYAVKHCLESDNAVKRGAMEDVVDRLIRVDEMEPCGAVQRALCDAIKGGSVDLTRRLLDSRVTVYMNNEDNERNVQAPLMLAAKCGHTEIATLLLDRGADVNWTVHSISALRYAVEAGQEPVARVLLERGIDVDSLDMFDNTTALIDAATIGDEALVSLLLGYGADTELFGDHSALMCASEAGHLGVVRMLLAKGAHVGHECPNCGMTALTLAMANGHTLIVVELAQHAT
jgi:ankyrin repeat protein